MKVKQPQSGGFLAVSVMAHMWKFYLRLKYFPLYSTDSEAVTRCRLKLQTSRPTTWFATTSFGLTAR